MSVTACHYDQDSPCSVQYDEAGRGTYTVKYIILANSLMAPGAVLAGARGLGGGNDAIPAKYSTFSYQGDTDAYSYQLRADLSSRTGKESNYVWTAIVHYSPIDNARTTFKNPGDMIAVPTNRPVSWWWDREVYTRTVDKTFDNKPVLNAASEPFDEQIEEEETRGVLVAEKNVANLGLVIGYNRLYEGAVNSVTWNHATYGISLGPRTTLCREVSSGPVTIEGSYSYYRVTFRFAIKENNGTWDHEELNRGFRAKDPNDLNGPSKEIYREALVPDGNGGFKTVNQKITSPVLLKPDGTDAMDDPLLANYLKFRTKREVSFDALSGVLQ